MLGEKVEGRCVSLDLNEKILKLKKIFIYLGIISWLGLVLK